mmetsp:Transcript_39216/g.76591  ORF Transcript_39216/g.76591 Transcript_39216/m.76591 type:complete len:106 (+) Transcript_39216:125-442(+)|eukprot:CAMPEP_0194324114 /NCGR_PEP_ID=MMETSP0171-20130528/26529_1 /TAXON_ID=218684 /ORGANISM="Corethron pennatum, Strain L29A3" /LENGTH=105 /DNA_ID=CAMNT_0039082929 /DNA_START=125 /DNA_END=442 /DNA_ORIENTATION=-
MSTIFRRIGSIFVDSAAPAAAAAPSTKSVARERLSVILASQRGSELLKHVDLEAMKAEVLTVVRKHIRLADDRPVSFNVSSQGEVVELQVEVEACQKRGGGSTKL